MKSNWIFCMQYFVGHNILSNGIKKKKPERFERLTRKTWRSRKHEHFQGETWDTDICREGIWSSIFAFGGVRRTGAKRGSRPIRWSEVAKMDQRVTGKPPPRHLPPGAHVPQKPWRGWRGATAPSWWGRRGMPGRRRWTWRPTGPRCSPAGWGWTCSCATSSPADKRKAFNGWHLDSPLRQKTSKGVAPDFGSILWTRTALPAIPFQNPQLTLTSNQSILTQRKYSPYLLNQRIDSLTLTLTQEWGLTRPVLSFSNQQ